jgi:hypothetical protein
MRRWLTAVAVGAVAALALTGCGAPAGVDRDLADDWPALGEPRVFVPERDVCHLGLQDVGYLTAYHPVDCGESHRVETLHIGTLTGADASRGTPPPAGSAPMRAAHAECDREVNKVVGADWRTGRLGLTVVFPSSQGWTGGARWFRCDVSEIGSLDEPGVVPRTGSLKGALSGASTLVHRCFNPKLSKDDVTAMMAVACTSKHHAEFVGVYQAPEVGYASYTGNSQRMYKGCQPLIATFAKVPRNGDLDYRAGGIFYHPSEQEWKDGNRGIQCFLWISDRNLTRSMKGAGTTGLPVT